MKVDDILRLYLGQAGRFQVYVVVLVSLEVVFMGMQTLAPVFLSATPPFRCARTAADDAAEDHGSSPGGGGFSSGIDGSLVHTGTENSPSEDAQISTGDIQLSPTESTMMGNGSTAPTPPWDEQCYFAQVLNSSVLHLGSPTTPPTPPPSSLQGFSTDQPRSNHSSGRTTPCSAWEFDTSQHTTLVSEFQLVCDRQWLVPSAASAFLAGRVIGDPLSGYMSDRFGRRKVVLVAGTGSVIISVLCAVSPNYSFFLVFRTLSAFFASGKSVTVFIIATEYIGPRWRPEAGTLQSLTWAIGCVILAGLAYLVRSWRYLLLCINVPEILLYIAIYFTVPESPRWLYLKGRRKEADDIIRKMARFNRVTLPAEWAIDEKETAGSHGTLAILRSRPILLLTLVQLWLWVTDGFVFYGLSLHTSKLGGNPYVNFVIMSAVEIPAMGLVVLGFNKLGRRLSFAASFLGTSLTMAAIIPAILTDHKTALLVLAGVGKFMISVAFAMSWNYTTEVYPTCIRNAGLAICSSSARVASALASYVGLLSTFNACVPYVVFAGMALVSSAMILSLPETRDQPLTQTVQQGELFVASRGYLCLRGKRIDPENDDQATELRSRNA